MLWPSFSFGNIIRENFWPLWQRRDNPIEKVREVEALGPLYFSQEKDKEKEWGLRPLFSTRRDESEDTREIDILYPLFTYRREKGESRFQFIQLLSSRSEERETKAREGRFTLFPFLFYGWSEERPGYFALAPFYGTIRDRFGFDEIKIRFFYLETIRAEVRTRMLFPFYSQTEGKKERGFRLWPFYGFSEKEGKSTSYFVAWPFILSQKTGLDTDNPRETFSFLPFYAASRSPERDFTSYLWPFFSHVEDRKREYSEWGLPYPFVIYASGTGRQALRILPLIGWDQRAERYSFFFAFPLYMFIRSDIEEVSKIRHQFLFWLYSDLQEEDREQEVSKRRVDMWPLLSYYREEDGSVSFQALSLLEPFFPKHEGIKRNLSPLWGIYRYRRDAEGNRWHSLLWNLIRRERGEDYSRWEILGPLFTRQVKEGEIDSFSILKGLFGFGREKGKGFLQILYLKLGGQ